MSGSEILLRGAISAFDAWKETQDRSDWTSHGWQLRSKNSGFVFINSRKEIDQATLDSLTDTMSVYCKIVSIERK